MPFTPSHAVVALPFVRTPLPFGAVAVGSMAPDVPLFFPVGVTYEQTHGFPSLLVFSVPVAMLLYLVWRVLLRPAARALLPTSIGSRLPTSWDSRGHGYGPEAGQGPGVDTGSGPGLARTAPWALLALVLGVVTHVFWDAFTHPDRFGSMLIPALAEQWGPLVGTQWAQYVSSVGGLVVLGIAAVRYLRRTPPTTSPQTAALVPAARIRLVFWASLAAALVAGVVIVAATRGLPTDVHTAKSFTFFAGTLAGALVLVATAVAAVAVQLIRARAHPRRA
ncbi:MULTISPECIES: DUF4184 family protein [unclassified Frigoribacterium]|uniref:DUF4184 family protein n=1 Tax=unclassified Frigoribacterium TaxID=2627005 RepID=UPI0006F2581C|nr:MULTISPECIES: DUF4184 family protein [unclassified Frigoribacterium]KQO48302.1 hypothetical protein ASF07_13355 [Frigoribacterium sp. Leaf254]KQT40394.1 hypothetical protein ASG28_13360 [Frigoribacterium sp. Leaf415]